MRLAYLIKETLDLKNIIKKLCFKVGRALKIKAASATLLFRLKTKTLKQIHPPLGWARTK